MLTGIPSAFNQITLTRLFGKIPINIVYMLVIVAVLWIVINRTELGQRGFIILGAVALSSVSRRHALR